MLFCMSDHCSAHIKYQLFGLYMKMHYTTFEFSSLNCPHLYPKNLCNNSSNFNKHVTQLKRMDKYSIISGMALHRNSPIYLYQAPGKGKDFRP